MKIEVRRERGCDKCHAITTQIRDYYTNPPLPLRFKFKSEWVQHELTCGTKESVNNG